MSGASDLLLHLTPCDIAIDLQGRSFTIPAMDALGWLKLLCADTLDPYTIFPVLAGDEAIEHTEDALWEGRITADELHRTALEVIAIAGDRPWWVTLRLLASVTDAWDRIHVNHAAGMSLAGWLDEVWSKTMSLMEPKRIAGWVGSIEAPPKGWEKEVDFDAEERAFMAAMRSVM